MLALRFGEPDEIVANAARATAEDRFVGTIEDADFDEPLVTSSPT